MAGTERITDAAWLGALPGHWVEIERVGAAWAMTLRDPAGRPVARAEEATEAAATAAVRRHVDHLGRGLYGDIARLRGALGRLADEVRPLLDRLVAAFAALGGAEDDGPPPA